MFVRSTEYASLLLMGLASVHGCGEGTLESPAGPTRRIHSGAPLPLSSKALTRNASVGFAGGWQRQIERSKEKKEKKGKKQRHCAVRPRKLIQKAPNP